MLDFARLKLAQPSQVKLKLGLSLAKLAIIVFTPDTLYDCCPSLSVPLIFDVFVYNVDE